MGLGGGGVGAGGVGVGASSSMVMMIVIVVLASTMTMILGSSSSSSSIPLLFLLFLLLLRLNATITHRRFFFHALIRLLGHGGTDAADPTYRRRGRVVGVSQAVGIMCLNGSILVSVMMGDWGDWGDFFFGLAAFPFAFAFAFVFAYVSAGVQFGWIAPAPAGHEIVPFRASRCDFLVVGCVCVPHRAMLATVLFPHDRVVDELACLLRHEMDFLA